ncbi:VOC family protein [Agaribacterium haliotis]|uniref:VOC family protein n=1 Tax=Agaribacterium haliotis TaxID=2013869 RepID=UPI001959B95D|nr:VOC family protein [Agaribacterium haliotis]
MKNVGFLYKSSVGLGCLTLMFSSIACTGWFFYSWLGGLPGMIGAGVGCAVQLMAYGFSGVIVHQENGPLRLVLLFLIASALALSILSSYATLNGYFSALQDRNEAARLIAEQKERAMNAALEQRVQLMESMSRDVEIAASAANQGLSERYRTQAKRFLEDNEATRSQMAEQIEKVEQLAQQEISLPDENKQASPIDGLAQVLGGQNTAIRMLCLWLAFMFDALPIVAITLFEARNKQPEKNNTDNSDSQVPAPPSIEAAIEAPSFEELVEQNKDPLLIDVDKAALEEKKPQLKLLTNICSHNLQASKAFFSQLLGLETKYDSDWYVQFFSSADPELEFGIIQYDHELIPENYRSSPSGMYMTFVVEDVDQSYKRALELGVDIIQEPRNEFYGQRRFLAREPSGCLIDICSPFDA